MLKELKIVFFGTPEFAIPALSRLIQEGCQITCVVTAPDKPVGRDKKLTPPVIKVLAEASGIKINQPETLKDATFLSEFGEEQPDVAVVVAYGKIIPGEYLKIPKYGFLNIHPSLLPKYRGPTPIQSALLNGEVETGVSIMALDEEVDHGPVLMQQKAPIENSDDYLSLSKKLSILGSEMLVRTLEKIMEDGISAQNQDHEQATFTRIYSREDGEIEWDKPAREIFNKIRALNPEPGTWTKWKDRVLKISGSEILMDPPENIPSGAIVEIHGQIAIKTKDNLLKVKRIQLEGKKGLDALEFAHGQRDFIGSKLG